MTPSTTSATAATQTDASAPAQTSSAETHAANANDDPAALVQGQNVCDIDDKNSSATILIARPVGETKTVDIQSGHDYLFGFSKADVTNVTQKDGLVTLTFDCGGVLILKNYSESESGANPAKFAFADAAQVNALAPMIQTAQTNVVTEEETDSSHHHKHAHGHDQGKNVNVANIEPAAGDDQIAQKVANIEPAAGPAAAGAPSGGGYGFNSTFSAESVNALNPTGPLAGTQLAYGTNFAGLPTLFLTGNALTPLSANGTALTDSENNIGNPVTGHVDTSGGAGGASIAIDGSFSATGSLLGGVLSSGGVPIVVNPTPNGYTGTAGGVPVFTITVTPGTNDYIFTLLKPLDHADGNNPADVIDLHFGIVITDNGGNQTIDKIDISVVDGGPAASPAKTDIIDETGLGAASSVSVSDSLVINFGADKPGTVHGDGITSIGGALTGSALTSHGVPVVITQTPTGYVGTAGGVNVFTITINNAGAYTFTLNQPLDHNVQGGTINLNFGIAVQDYDGDATHTTIHINVVDSIPHIGAPAAGSGLDTIDESNLGPITVNGTLAVDFGADKPGNIHPNNVFTPSGSLLGNALTSHGVPVTVTQTATGYVGTAGGVTVFTLTINATTGAYSFVLNAPLDHANAADPDDVITLKFGVQATDSEGGSANNTITINVKDDAPIAHDVSVNDTTLSAITGNALGNSHVSSDGTLITTITFHGVNTTVPANGNATINGDFGTLVISANGVYTYTPHQGATGIDNFTFTARDFDGDTSQANLSINVSVDDHPVVTQPPVPTSIHESTTVVTTNGTIATDFGHDGPGVIAPTGSFTSNGSLAGSGLTSHGVPVTVTQTANGYVGTAGATTIFTLVITPGTGAYTFTLNGPLDHADGHNPADIIGLNFGVKATDVDGDVTNSTLTINVVDDAPLAANDTASTNSVTPITGNIFANDHISADRNTLGVTQHVSVDIHGIPHVNILPGAGSIIGDYGTLTIDAQGNYTYTPNGALTNGTAQDVFTYAIGDGDGDASTASLVINVTGVAGPTITPPSGAPTNVDESNLTPTTSTTTNGTIGIDYGAQGAGTVVLDRTFTSGGSQANGQLTSHGVPVAVITTPDGAVGTVNGVNIFTLVLNQTTGAYNFTLLGPLDHADGSNANDVIDLNFGIKATNAHGGASVSTLTIHVVDDAPTAANDSVTGSSAHAVSGNVLTNDHASADAPTTLSAVTFNGITKTIATGASVDITGGHGVLHISSDGTYTYTEQGGQNGVDNFTYTSKDFDGDTAQGTLAVTVNDNNVTPPVISQSGDTTVTESTHFVTTGGVISANYGTSAHGALGLTGVFSADGSLSHSALTSNGVTVNVSYTPNLYTGTANGQLIFSLSLNPATGDYTFLLNGPLDHADGNNPADVINLNFGVQATDDAGTSNSTLTIHVVDDHPTAHADTASTTGTTPVTGVLFATADVGADTTATPFARIEHVNTAGSPVFGETITGPGIIHGNLGTLTILDTQGHYSYTANAGMSGQDAFLYTIKDADGDTSTSNLIITVAPGATNDHPVIASTPADINLDETDHREGTSVVSVNFGHDSPGTIVPNLTFSADGSLKNGTLTSNGAAITISQAGNYIIGSANGHDIFHFSPVLTNSSGLFDFRLLGPLDHSDTFNANEIINLHFGVTATDSNGDTATTSVTVHVSDDAPIAVNDTNATTSGSTVSGNVLINDTLSFDSLANPFGFIAHLQHASNGTPYLSTLPVPHDMQGDFGVLTLNVDGSYSYKANAGAVGTDLFNYELQDSDGDKSDGTLTITVTAGSGGGGPTITPPTDQSVDESNFRPGFAPQTAHGAVTATGNGAITFTADHAFIANGSTLGNLLTAGGFPVSVSQTDSGYVGIANGLPIFTFTINSSGSYDFVLNTPLDHADANNPNDVIDLKFGVQATDAHGGVSTSIVTVHVADDAPSAVSDSNATTGGSTVTGNVLANDYLSADAIIGPNFVTNPFSFIGHTDRLPNGTPILHTVSAGQSINGDYGTLTVNTDGGYTYTANAGATGTDLFNYRLIDKDGDTSDANLTITVNAGGGGTPTNDHPTIISVQEVNIDETDKREGTSVVSVNFGNDSPGTIIPNGTFSADGSLKNGTLTSHGAAVTISQVGNFIIGSANGHDVFHLAPVLTNSNGLFDFTLLGPLDHNDGADVNDVINLHFGVTARDSNGDTTTGTITVHVADDSPTAVTDNVSTAANTPVSGNIFANDNFGFDGQGGLAAFQHLHLYPNGVLLPAVQVGPGSLAGTLGVLNISANGDFTYTPDAGSYGTDTFTYIIGDADADGAVANIVFTVAPPPVVVVPPTVLLTTNSGSEAHVYEDGRVFVPIHAQVSGGDSAATLTINVSGISWWDWTYSGSGGLVDQGNGVLSVTLAPGVTDWNGGFTVAPPHNADFDINNIVVTATVNDNGVTATDTHNFPIINDAVADQPILNVQDGQAYNWYIQEGHDAPLSIQAAVSDTDGSEVITKVTLDLTNGFNFEIPPTESTPTNLEQAGFVLNKGVDNGGVWEIAVNGQDASDALSGLALHELPFSSGGGAVATILGYYVGTLGIDITVRAYSQETNLSGGEFDTSNNISVTSANYHLSMWLTPLVLDLNGDGVNLVDRSAGVMFDMNNNGSLDHTSWVGPKDGLLSIDLNHDGVINNQSELFGNTSSDIDGFSHLAHYDSNGDGKIDAKDADFSKLLIWQDVNQDGVSQVGELHSLNDMNIASIKLASTAADYMIGDSEITHEGNFTFADGHEGQIVDAWFNVEDGNAANITHVLNGTDFNDILIGSSGKDAFYGGAGDNVIYGNGGDDIFLFKSAHDGVDTIKDFHVGNVIDISGLIGHDPVQESINQFVFKTENNGNTTISVDATGTGDVAHAQTLAVLQGVTGLDLDQIIHHAQQQAVAA